MSKENPNVSIQVVSDVLCPWCWVGKRKLEEAIEKIKDKYTFNVRWEPYLLRPDMPLEGKPKTIDPNNTGVGHLKAAGQSVGIDFTVKAPIYPNTLAAHILLEYAATVDGGSKQNDVAEMLFKGYFTDGKSLTEKDLLDVASEAGFDTSKVQTCLYDPDAVRRIKTKAKSWSEQGINGVPYFIINGKPAFSGAQDVNTFIKVIEKLACK